MINLIIYFPLINAVLSGTCGKTLGNLGIRYISAISLISSQAICFYVLSAPINEYIDFGVWMSLGTFTIRWSFLIDNLTLTMFLIVNTVSILVHIYSFYYMATDPSLPRFISYLSLFTFFMNILVSAGNLVVLFIGWEGVGLCSYLLIGFWYTRFQANKSAMKALVVNRIGDYFFLLGCFVILIVFQSTEWSVFLSFLYLSNTFILNTNTISLITIFLFLGAMAKSAQIGLHTWLPDAMEGPTPVSALIHAATMVTAGVFLLLRLAPLLCFTPKWILLFITLIGILTALFAATAGLVQNDLKKVIAYSTCSQLGYMVFSCGLLNFSASFFHLFNHAFFKALLFLGAGSVIHSLSGEQDMRRMGGLARQIPLISCVMLIASLSLAGFPFLSGFYSKDIILESALSQYTTISGYAYWIGVLVAFLTAFYSFRLIILVFLGKNRSYKTQISSLHPTHFLEILVVCTLCLLSIFSGFCGQIFFTSPGSDFLSLFTFDLPLYNVSDFEFLPTRFKLLPTIGSVIGITLSFILHQKLGLFTNARRTFYLSYVFLMSKWGFDFVFNTFFSKGVFFLSLLINDLVEKQLEYYLASSVKFFSILSIKNKVAPVGIFSFVQITFFVFLIVIVFFLFAN